MAFPTIPTAGAGRVLFTNQADTSATRTFPNLSSLTKDSGDLLIAIITTYQSTTNPQFSSWGGGFTEFTDQGSSTTLGIGAAYKWSTGSETGTFTVTQASTITGEASMVLLSIPGAHATTPPEAGTIANGTSAAADPGSFNPSGWDAEDTLWISVIASGMTSGTGSWTGTGTTAPTNYTDRADSNTTDNSTTGQTEIAVAFRQVNAASEDAGTGGVDTSNARNSALVIAVRPAAVVSLAVNGLTVGNTLGQPTLTQHHVLSVNGLTVGNTISQPTLTQHNILSVNGLTVGVTTGSPTLTNTLIASKSITLAAPSGYTVHNVANTTQISNPACIYYGLSVAVGDQFLYQSTHASVDADGLVTATSTFQFYWYDDSGGTWSSVQTITLTLASANMAQGVTIGNVTLTPVAITVTPNALAVGVTIGQPTLTQHNILAVQGLAVGNTLENVTLTVGGSVSPDDLSLGQSLQSPSLVQHHVLSVNGLTVGTTTGNVSLTQHHVLSVNGLTLGQSLGNVTLTPSGVLIASKSITLSAPSGWTVHNVTDISEAGDAGTLYYGQSPAVAVSDQILYRATTANHSWPVTVDTQGFFSVDSGGSNDWDTFDYYIYDATDGSWGAVGTITLPAIITPNTLFSATAITNVTLTQSNTMPVNGMTVGASIDNVTVLVSFDLTLADLSQSVTIGSPTLTQHNVLQPGHLAVGVTVGIPTLTQQNLLTVQGLTVGNTLQAATLTQHNVLQPNTVSVALAITQPSTSALYQLAVSNLNLSQTITAADVYQVGTIDPSSLALAIAFAEMSVSVEGGWLALRIALWPATDLALKK